MSPLLDTSVGSVRSGEDLARIRRGFRLRLQSKGFDPLRYCSQAAAHCRLYRDGMVFHPDWGAHLSIGGRGSRSWGYGGPMLLRGHLF